MNVQYLPNEFENICCNAIMSVIPKTTPVREVNLSESDCDKWIVNFSDNFPDNNLMFLNCGTGKNDKTEKGNERKKEIALKLFNLPYKIFIDAKQSKHYSDINYTMLIDVINRSHNRNAITWFVLFGAGFTTETINKLKQYQHPKARIFTFKEFETELRRLTIPIE